MYRLVKEVRVPLYPMVGATIRILGQNNEVWFGLTEDVNYETRRTGVRWDIETRRQGVWTLSNQRDQVHFSSVTKICQANRAFGGFSIV